MNEKDIPYTIVVERYVIPKCKCGFKLGKYVEDGYVEVFENPYEEIIDERYTEEKKTGKRINYNYLKRCPSCGQLLEWKYKGEVIDKDYKIGDIVQLADVGVDDTLRGRYIGEEGIFQGQYEDDEEACYVFFKGFGEYVTYYEQIELVKPATIETIFEAFNKLIGNEALVERVKDFTENGR